MEKLVSEELERIPEKEETSSVFITVRIESRVETTETCERTPREKLCILKSVAKGLLRM